jgi:hypothetical protein
MESSHCVKLSVRLAVLCMFAFACFSTDETGVAVPVLEVARDGVAIKAFLNLLSGGDLKSHTQNKKNIHTLGETRQDKKTDKQKKGHTKKKTDTQDKLKTNKEKTRPTARTKHQTCYKHANIQNNIINYKVEKEKERKRARSS